jgi:hypothetical protein
VYAKKMGIIRRNLESGHHKKNPTRRSLGKIKKKKDRKQREWERERERKNPKNIKKKKNTTQRREEEGTEGRKTKAEGIIPVIPATSTRINLRSRSWQQRSSNK